MAFVAQAWPHAWIEVMNADGTNVQTLTKERGDASSPVWLPRDAGIAFLAGASSNGSLFVMHSDGTHAQRIALQGTDQFTWIDAPLTQRC
jgi:Tol biopolymer transport system component